MIVSENACNEAGLHILLTDDESSHQYQSALKHVDSCAACQVRLEQMAAESGLWQEAQQVLTTSPASVAGGAEDDGISFPWNRRPIAWSESMAKSLLAPPSHPELLGRIGRYDVERLIGSGGMGVVFKAYDTELNRVVAVKLLAPYLAENGSARKRFAREARSAAGVVDDHVVPIYNVESENDPPFLVMQYVAGGSLQETVDRDGPLDVCEILRIGMQSAKGLAAAHAQGLIHRDVKPSNILLDEGVERALLTDFGLARAEDDACLTRSGFHPGTPHYMSPEQVRGEAIDGRSDLFGLGCVLYALCTGHPPFRADTSYAVLRRITDDAARPIRELNPDIPEWLERIVMKLLSKSREDRFDSAEQVAELLEDCLAHVQHPTITPLPELATVSPPARSGRPPWSKFIAAAAFGLSLIFAGVLIVLEMNKGTLTIESDADDVPIRITQGDDIVKELKVTKGTESVRIAAGNYLVELDGKFEGVVVDNGLISLKQRGEETVKLRMSSAQSATAQATSKANENAFDVSEFNAYVEPFSPASASGDEADKGNVPSSQHDLGIDSKTTTGNLLHGTWEIEISSPGQAKRSGFAAFSGNAGMIASSVDGTDPLRFTYVIQPNGNQLRIDLQATNGAVNGGPSRWNGIVEASPSSLALCFAREDQIEPHGRPGSIGNANLDVFVKVTFIKRTAGSSKQSSDTQSTPTRADGQTPIFAFPNRYVAGPVYKKSEAVSDTLKPPPVKKNESDIYVLAPTIASSAIPATINVDAENRIVVLRGNKDTVKLTAESLKMIMNQPDSATNATTAEPSVGESPTTDKPKSTQPTLWANFSTAEPSFGLSPAAKDLAKLHTEFRETEAASIKSRDEAADGAEANRVRKELDPRAIMPAKYLTFEEKHRGTDSGLKALTAVAKMALGEFDPASHAHKGLVEARRRVTAHYLDHHGLETIAELFDRWPFFAESDGFLQTLIDKSPHRETRANALIAQVIQGKELLTHESELPEVLEKMVIDDEDSPQFNEKLQDLRKQLENMDFKQLRADLNEKLKELAEAYSDVDVAIYGTGGEAAERLGHAINHVIVHTEVPEMTATDINGQEFRLSKLRGKIVVLLFAEHEDDYKEMYGPLRQLVAKYERASVEFVGIMSNADPANLLAASKRGELPWTVIPQPMHHGPLKLDWGIEEDCHVYIIDKQGILQPQLNMPFYGDGGYDAGKVDDKIAELIRKPMVSAFGDHAPANEGSYGQPVRAFPSRIDPVEKK